MTAGDGIPFGTAGQRADMLDEACELVTGLFADDRTDFEGTRYRLHGAPLVPKPVQDPLPIMIGGKGERRTIPTVVRWAHEWNGWCSPDEMRHYNAEAAQAADLRARASVRAGLSGPRGEP